jgi:hypothetical protein
MINISTIQSSLSNTLGRTGLVLTKFGPEILLGLGLGGGIATIILACVATKKLDPITMGAHNDLERVKQYKLVGENFDGVPYTADDAKKDTVAIYGQTGLAIAKLYLPTVSVGLFSAACILGSHGLMTKRNVALLAAYNLVAESFKGYRERVAEEVGVDKERHIRFGYKEDIKTETVIDPETGKKSKVKSSDLVKMDIIAEDYHRLFDKEHAGEWVDDPVTNGFTLRTQQNYWNDVLRVRGHVFLNEVFHSLGIKATTTGNIVGWVKGHGDNFIDFGFYNPSDAGKISFANGNTADVWLDFNVDGPILDMI